MIVSGAHLVGSIPLADTDTVFRTVVRELAPHLARLPDGETGIRKNWIAWQYGVLAGTPGFVVIPAGDRGYLRRQLVQLAGPRTAPQLGPLGYADAALASFAIFDRLQRTGAIPPTLRFQVSLPTPLAPVTVFVDHPDREIVEPVYEAQMLLGELAAIARAIPHDRLAIQWDVAVEVGLLERAWPAHFPDVEAGIRARLRRICAAVPADVELGLHLCYGDFGHRHFANPPDATTLVRIANLIDRPLAWLHLPVPLAWTTAAAFAPLRELAHRGELYLGVVHIADGVTGARARIALATAALPAAITRIGIATECGWGRRPVDSVAPLLALHAAILDGR